MTETYETPGDDHGRGGGRLAQLGERGIMHVGEGGNVADGDNEVMVPVRVLLIDDHLMVTEALAARLSTSADLWVAGRCAASDPNLLQIVAGVRPDVITVEVADLGDAAEGLLAKLVGRKVPVVVLSSARELGLAVAAARAGVAAWVAKEQGAAELENVLRGVVHGEAWWPPPMLGVVLRELRADVARAKAHDDVLGVLSRREREVLASMMEGKQASQIAGDMTISTDTVRTHIRNIFAKLDVHTRLEAVKVARAAGLAPAAHS
jgi:DNA-binding NarL/FixJ family response regulator